jgi:hypothetical protein
MTNTFFVIEVYFFYDQAKWSRNWSRKRMPRGTAHAGYWRGKAHADMDMMTWLFDTAPRVALGFVHVSSSEWSTCRTQVCPRVALRFVHMSFLVGPPFHFWLGHTFDSGCDMWLLLNAPRVSFQFHCQYTYNSQERNFCIYNIFIWHKAYNRQHKHVLDSQDNHVHRRHNHVHKRHNHVHIRHIRLSRTQDKFRSDSSTSLQVPAKQNFQEEVDPSKIPWQPSIIKV